MKLLLVILIFTHQYSTFFTHASPADDIIDVNGGVACAACTILVGIVEQLTEINNQTVTDTVSQLCGFLPDEYSMLCDILVHLWGPSIIEKLTQRESPDVICYSLGICHVDPGQSYCHLFPRPRGGMEYAVQMSRQRSTVQALFDWTLVEKMQSACELPGVSKVCRTLESVLSNMKPFLDLDKDKYSIIQTLRGNSWRGKDCDDVNEMIYPGRKPINRDISMDSNCNGIHGVNPETEIPYEEELCNGTQSRGLIYIGDSIGAHFHVPPEWLTASELTMESFRNFSFVLGNEMDWPQASFPTGFENVSWPILNATTDSVYLRLRERNLCNHRDFQNICFNGAASGTMLSYLRSIARNIHFDKPALVFYALMGNDVCNRYMNSLDDLITPAAFRSNVMQSLEILSSLLPPDSHVILVGLVNGSFIYDTMKDHLHPIGKLHKDVDYDDVYSWFNCMRIGPCYGWMNRNATVREVTTARAVELTEVLQDIVAKEKYNNFKLHYLRNPMNPVVQRWIDEGHELWQFLEPVDSLHPVQDVLPLITETVWSDILEQFPEVLGEINPNNVLIKSIFGDQGGH